MTRSRGFARISLSSARWLLPWIAVLLVSVSLAYAMNTAIDGGASASDRQPVVHAAVSTGEAAVGMALANSSEVCDTTGGRMFYVGLNSWIPAETGAARCREQSTTSLSDTALAPSEGRFGVMSTTSPASTGHASSDGCCTWD